MRVRVVLSLRRVAVLAVAGCLWSWNGLASDKIPLFPGSLQPLPGEHLQVEQIEIGRLVAIPANIQRPAGRFILLITNRNASDPNTAFSLIPAAATAPTQPIASANAVPVGGTAAIQPSAAAPSPITTTPILQLGGGAYDAKHRSASIFAAVTGTYSLVNPATGKVMCTITIQ